MVAIIEAILNDHALDYSFDAEEQHVNLYHF